MTLDELVSRERDLLRDTAREMGWLGRESRFPDMIMRVKPMNIMVKDRQMFRFQRA